MHYNNTNWTWSVCPQTVFFVKKCELLSRETDRIYWLCESTDLFHITMEIQRQTNLCSITTIHKNITKIGKRIELQQVIR